MRQHEIIWYNMKEYGNVWNILSIKNKMLESVLLCSAYSLWLFGFWLWGGTCSTQGLPSWTGPMLSNPDCMFCPLWSLYREERREKKDRERKLHTMLLLCQSTGFRPNPINWWTKFMYTEFLWCCATLIKVSMMAVCISWSDLDWARSSIIILSPSLPPNIELIQPFYALTFPSFLFRQTTVRRNF